MLTGHVLYVDDDDATRRLVERDLRRHGFEVSLAAGGVAGEAAIREAAGRDAPFDVVCLDHYMPEQDGLETLAHLRLLSDVPPVIFVTGSEEGRLAVAALRGGACAYVIKEASGDYLHLLRATIMDALDREQVRRARDQAMRDLQEARDRAEELAAERAMLLREVNHRVANSLQLITSLILLRERQCDESGRAALSEIRARIFALGQIHRRLYAVDDVRVVAADEYLGGLVSELGRSITDGATRATIDFSAPPAILPTDRAVPLGVMLAELVTNAVKYAYPDGEGPVRVSFGVEGDTGLLEVADQGVGRREGAPSGTGLGSAVIGAMAEALDARVEHMDNAPGLKVSVRFALR